MSEPTEPRNDHTNGGSTDKIVETIGWLGSSATPPSWSTIISRCKSRSHRAWLSSLLDRRVMVLAVAGLAVLIVAGSALAFGSDLFDDDATGIETVNTPEDPSAGVTPDDGAEESGEGGEELPGAGELVAGCFEPTLDLSVASGPGRANIDGLGHPDLAAGDANADDDWLWLVGPPVPNDEPVTPTHLMADLAGAGVIVLGELEPGRMPSVETPWPVGFDLDGDGAEELLLMEQANNFRRVEVYRLDGCDIVRVPVEGDARFDGGFPVEASSDSCQDWCNVGLMCRADGVLVSTESEPLDPGNGRGVHQWTAIEWRLDNGVLMEVGRETGTAEFADLAAIDVANEVSCNVERDGNGQQALPHADEAQAIADVLEAEVLVGIDGPVWEAQSAGYVVVDGEVARHDSAGYRVVGVAGDALATLSLGEAGPRLDLTGAPIECPAYSGFVDGTAADPFRTLAVDPVLQDDGGWALLMPGSEFGDPIDFGDPLPFDALADQWWEMPLYEVDCETGQQVRVPSTSGTRLPASPGEAEDPRIFMDILRRGNTTLYVTGDVDYVMVLDAEGDLIVADGFRHWQLSEDGSILAVVDVAGVVRGVDAVTGVELWINDRLDGFDASEGVVSATFLTGDRMILTHLFDPRVAMISISSGETLVPSTTLDTIRVTYVR